MRMEVPTFMFTLKGLHATQVPATVIIVESFILLLNPVLGLIHITMEALHLMS